MHNHALGGRIIQLNVLRRNLFRKKSAGCALYDGQRPMMETIVCHPGCTQQELASMLCITPASVELSTKRLQKAGFLEKRRDADNQRCNRLYATEAAKALVQEQGRAFDEVDAVTFAGLSEQDRETLRRLLDHMIQNLSSDGDVEFPAPPCFWKETD